jgi:hypothetical protein
MHGRTRAGGCRQVLRPSAVLALNLGHSLKCRSKPLGRGRYSCVYAGKVCHWRQSSLVYIAFTLMPRTQCACNGGTPRLRLSLQRSV